MTHLMTRPTMTQLHTVTHIVITLLWLTNQAAAQHQEPPRILVVSAHPDDEFACAATIYKITHDLNGVVDEVVITNGEAGFKYATLADAYYGKELTVEAVGRSELPTIRKKEMMAGGAIIGIRKYFFFDEQDNTYTLNVDSVLKHVWDVDAVQRRMKSILARESYDYVFCPLPTRETHGHHKAATILLIRVVQQMPVDRRPVVLATSSSSASDTVREAFTELDGFPETRISAGTSSFTLDRTVKFGFRNRLDYRIVVNWLIAEHKSQGALQLSMNRDDYEHFWWFDINDRKSISAVTDLFARLALTHFKPREY